jgi:hypothetical protein
MASCFGKTDFLVAYDVRGKYFLYENVSTENFASDCKCLRLVEIFLDSSKSKRKYEFLSFYISVDFLLKWKFSLLFFEFKTIIITYFIVV